MAVLRDAVARTSRTEPARLAGLLGWLPLSRVAWWTDDGLLHLDPNTDVADLTVRYAAWIASQPVPRDQADLVRRYVTTTVELAAASRDLGHPNTTRPKRVDTAAATTTAIGTLDPAISSTIRALLASFDASFLERSQQVRFSLLALLARQHVLLLGPPGTAKSMLARGLCAAFGEATYFEYLLSRFTHPDELFGPVSIPGLKEEDYRRLTDGFLPQAHVAFLDEIFKANSAILNSLLTLINERIFHHGKHRDPVPLIGVIGASNELPDPDGGLGALYDRFLIRLSVPPVAGPHSFLAVATGVLAPLEIGTPLCAADCSAVLKAADSVTVPPEVEDALIALWRAAMDGEWLVSDRRWRQAVRFLKVAAATDGRAALQPLDLLLLVPALAPEPAVEAEVRQAVLEHLSHGGIPQHDLRAQWMLLAMDRVAPVADDPLTRPPPNYAPWRERLTIRQSGIRKFLAHHQAAVGALTEERDALETAGRSHLWLAAVHASLLRPYLDGAGDLARILRVAEQYRDELRDPNTLAAALWARLPKAPHRVFGQSAVMRISVGGHPSVGLTPTGEVIRTTDGGGQVDPSQLAQLPELSIDATKWLSWIEGTNGPEPMMDQAPSYAARDIAMALTAVRRLLGHHAIVAPPELPAP
jgi:MoxR-like ATPase